MWLDEDDIELPPEDWTWKDHLVMNAIIVGILFGGIGGVALLMWAGKMLFG